MSDTKDTEKKFALFLHIFPKNNRENGGWNCCCEIESPADGRKYLEHMYESILRNFEEDRMKGREEIS